MSWRYTLSSKTDATTVASAGAVGVVILTEETLVERMAWLEIGDLELCMSKVVGGGKMTTTTTEQERRRRRETPES